MIQSVWLIEESHYYRDRDNHYCVDSEILIELGFFMDRAAVESLCGEMNSELTSSYEAYLNMLRNQDAAADREIKRLNREAAAIRAARMAKKDTPPRNPRVPPSFDYYLHTIVEDYWIYDAIEVNAHGDL